MASTSTAALVAPVTVSVPPVEPRSIDPVSDVALPSVTLPARDTASPVNARTAPAVSAVVAPVGRKLTPAPVERTPATVMTPGAVTVMVPVAWVAPVTVIPPAFDVNAAVPAVASTEVSDRRF